MIELSLTLWMGLSGFQTPELGDRIPAGLHPVGIILAATQTIDQRVMVFESPRISSRAIVLRNPILIHEQSLDALDALLRSAKVHRVPYTDRRGSPYIYVTLHPEKPPSVSLPYDVAVVRLRFADPLVVAKALNVAVKRHEKDLPKDTLRTHFVANPHGRQLVARFVSRERLDTYLELLPHLDTPPVSERKVVLKSYSCRHRMAVDVAREFGLAWEQAGRESFTIVTNRKSNSLLMRLPLARWEDVHKMLVDIDHPHIKK